MADMQKPVSTLHILSSSSSIEPGPTPRTGRHVPRTEPMGALLAGLCHGMCMDRQLEQRGEKLERVEGGCGLARPSRFQGRERLFDYLHGTC